MNSEIGGFRSQVDDLNAVIGDKESDINSLVAKIDELKIKMDKFKELVRINDNSIASLNEYLVSNDNIKNKEIDYLNNQIILFKKDLKEKNNNCKLLNEEIKILKDIIVEKDKTIESLK